MKRKYVVISLACYWSVLSQIAFCAPANPDQLQTTKQQALEQQKQINEPSVQLQKQITTADGVVLPKEAFRFPVKEFSLRGDERGSFKWLLKELEPYRGRLIGAGGINVLREFLENKVKERGFITTHIIVPQQQLKSGKLCFKILPGYVEDIRFSDPKILGSWRTAFPNRPGDILNIRELEQGLEQMRRVPNQTVEMKLEPGSVVNKSIIVLTVKRSKMWSAGITFDDAGTENTGRLQATGNLALYNPTGLNDVLSYSYSKDGEHQDQLHGTKDNSFSYSLPYGDYTFNVSRYYNEYYQQVPALVPFESRGKTTTWNFGLQKVLYRDSQRKIQGLVKLIKRRKESYADGQEIRVQSLTTTAYQVGLMERLYVGQGVVDATVYFQKGMPWFKAEPGTNDHVSDFMTTRYDLWGLNFYYATPFTLGSWQPKYSLTFRGQYTNNVLYGADQFSIGGRYTVRGFSGENTLAAENGFILRNEIGFPFKKFNMEPYIGLDYGRVWGPSSEGLLGKALAGGVIGVRGKIALQMSYDIFMGTPLYKPEGFTAGKTACGFNLYWQL